MQQQRKGEKYGGQRRKVRYHARTGVYMQESNTTIRKANW